jgi:hypothetical protein
LKQSLRCALQQTPAAMSLMSHSRRWLMSA